MAKNQEETLVLTSSKIPEEKDNQELKLRPTCLDDFIGQDSLKQNLRVIIQAAKGRGEPIDHIIFHGPPGLGKTSLAHVIGFEFGKSVRVTSGPAIERAGDLASILTNLQEGDILFIDEIHKLPRTIEEILYPAMEDFSLDLVIGKGPSAKTMRIELEHFTLIGATTRIGKISSPLRDRFGVQFHLDFYEVAEIKKIIIRSANSLGILINDDAAQIIAERSRRTPRIANRLLRRARDFSEVSGLSEITLKIAELAMEMLEIDNHGLTRGDKRLIDTINNNFSGGPVGLSTLSAALGESIDTIEDVYEPFLIREGLLDRTPRGRKTTDRAQNIGV